MDGEGRKVFFIDTTELMVIDSLVSMADVVKADLLGGKPFKEGGEEGYRDFINWATFVDHVRETAATEGVYLTNDKDFMENGKLHPQLDKSARGRDCQAALQVAGSGGFLEEFLPKA